MEPTIFREILWGIFIVVVFLLFLYFISGAPFKSKKKRYRIGMYDVNHFNSTLNNVEEESVMHMIMGYYYKPLYYLQIKDPKIENLIVIKASEQHEKDRVATENRIKQYLKNGSRIKVLTTRDKYFQITIQKHM